MEYKSENEKVIPGEIDMPKLAKGVPIKVPLK